MGVTPGCNLHVSETINNKPDIRVPSAAYGVDGSAHTTLKIRISQSLVGTENIRASLAGFPDLPLLSDLAALGS